MKNNSSVAAKPYNRCLTCPHRQERCDGPRTSAMTLLRWCEFMRDMKNTNGLTNQDIADKTGISIRTIDRLMALNCENDIMRETARLIEDAIIGSSNQYPCYLAFQEESMPSEGKLNDAMRDLEYALKDNKEYKKALDDIHASYKIELDLIRTEAEADRIDAQKKIDYLKEQVARLQRDNDYLWAENNRKSKVIDTFIDSVLHEKK